MNKQRIIELADLLSNKVEEENFDMSKWFGRYDIDYYNLTKIKDFENFLEASTMTHFDPYECGTACCIAGWTVAMSNNFKPINLKDMNVSASSAAAKYLDINKYQAYYIFHTDDHSVWNDVSDYYKEIEWDEDSGGYVGITPKIASKVLYDIALGNIQKFNEMEEDYNDTYSFID